MGQIKINNIIYGTTSAAEILYNDITVKEKLDTIPVFDINDNSNVSPSSDVLTYGHIIDNLNSSATDKVLSANQGRILKESIENIDFSPLEEAINNNSIAIDENKESILLLNEKDIELNNNIESINNTCVKEHYTLQDNVYVHYNPATLYPSSYANTGMIKIGLGLTSAMTNLYIDIWSYLNRGMIIAGGYTYSEKQVWYEPNALKLLRTNVNVRFAHDASWNKYILIGETNTNWGGYLRATISKAYSHYRDLPENITMELVTSTSGLSITNTF